MKLTLRGILVSLLVPAGVVTAACLYILVADHPLPPEFERLFPHVFAYSTCVFLVLSIAFVVLFPPERPSPSLLYGRHWIGGAHDRLESWQWKAALRAVREEPYSYPVQAGPVWLPDTLGRLGLVLFGAAGSGKTLSLRLLLQRLVASLVKGGPVRRIVVSDPKSRVPDYNLLNSLVAMVNAHVGGMRDSQRCPIYILNPFDPRCSRPNLTALVTEPKHAQAIADAWVRDPGTSGDGIYWRNASRIVLAGEMVVYSRLPKRTRDREFRDLLLGIRSPETLAHVLAQDPETEGLAKVFLHLSERQAAYVCGTLVSYLREFEPLAAGWHRAAGWQYAPASVDLRAWAKGESPGIIYLGGDDDNEALLGAFWSGLIQRMLSLNMQFPRGETWYVIDEAGTLEANRRPGERSTLATPLSQARQKGIRFAVAYQSFLQMVTNYGEAQAQELLSHLSNLIIFKQRGEAGADALSKHLGTMEVLHEVLNHSEQWGYGEVGMRHTSSGEGVSRAHGFKRVFEPGELQDLPLCTKQDGMRAVLSLESVGRFRAKMSGERLSQELIPHDTSVPAYLDWDEPLELQPWNEEDYRSLGLPQLREGLAKPPTAHPPAASPRRSFDELLREYAPSAYEQLHAEDLFNDEQGDTNETDLR